MRLPESDPHYAEVGGAAERQLCKGELIRFRTLNGICNDLTNPLMGSAGTVFGRNVEFETTFPDLHVDTPGHNRDRTMNRQGDRIALLTPDPQVISRRLFTREQSDADACNDGYGTHCDYKKAPFFNVLAAFWIQFMTHDWFSHLEEGHNDRQYMNVGCVSQKVNDIETPLTAAQVAQLGCRPGDAIDKSYVCRRSARQFQGQRRRPFRARAQDVPQQQHGVVGCVANLRLRLDLDRAGEARSARSGASPDAAAARARPPPATARAICPSCRMPIRKTPIGRVRKRWPFRTIGRSA